MCATHLWYVIITTTLLSLQTVVNSTSEDECSHSYIRLKNFAVMYILTVQDVCNYNNFVGVFVSEGQGSRLFKKTTTGCLLANEHKVT